MSVAALMRQSVTLRTPAGQTQDAIGEATTTYEELVTLMYLEPGRGRSSFGGGREDLVDRNTPIGDWVGIGRADVDFTSWSQIVYGTHTFDIIAPPRPVFNPTQDVVSHVELSLQEVT